MGTGVSLAHQKSIASHRLEVRRVPQVRFLTWVLGFLSSVFSVFLSL